MYLVNDVICPMNEVYSIVISRNISKNMLWPMMSEICVLQVYCYCDEDTVLGFSKALTKY